MFKIGQTALHQKADKYSSFDCVIANEVKELKNSNDLGKEHKRCFQLLETLIKIEISAKVLKQSDIPVINY